MFGLFFVETKQKQFLKKMSKRKKEIYFIMATIKGQVIS